MTQIPFMIAIPPGAGAILTVFLSDAGVSSRYASFQTLQMLTLMPATAERTSCSLSTTTHKLCASPEGLQWELYGQQVDTSHLLHFENSAWCNIHPPLVCLGRSQHVDTKVRCYQDDLGLGYHSRLHHDLPGHTRRSHSHRYLHRSPLPPTPLHLHTHTLAFCPLLAMERVADSSRIPHSSSYFLLPLDFLQ
eukprot:2063791-Rhodomonas_salina.1